MPNQIEELNKLSLFDFKDLFSSLKTPPREMLVGIYKGLFVGPGWLRRLSGPLLVVTRMGDWRGKDIDSDGNAINLVMSHGKIERRFPMLLVEQESLIDHKPCLALRYSHQNPLPWPWIIDELRSLGEGSVLGMTMIRLKPLQYLALPFVLQTQDGIDGL